MTGTTHPPLATPDAAARLQALADFVGVVSAARGRVDVLRLVAVAARKALAASAVSLSAWDADAELLRTLVNEGELGAGEVPSPVDETYTLAGLSLAQNVVLRGVGFAATVDSLPRGDPLRDLLISTGKDSCLGVPLVVEGEVWGELWATRTADLSPFGYDDVEFAGLVAGQAAGGVAQAEYLARVERLAYTDDLTSLANRRSFEDHLEDAVAQFRLSDVPIAVAVLDINGLKRINDRHGHLAGDAALASFGELLAAVSSAMPQVTAARLGGDEFALLCVGLPTQRIVAIAEEVIRRGWEELDEGVACGLAVASEMPGVVITPARLMRAADAAQYRAKQSRLAVPVIAGRRTSPADTLAAGASASDRRSYRDRTEHPELLETSVAALDASGSLDVCERLSVVAEATATMLDATGWWVSGVAAGSTMLQTRRYQRVVGRTELSENGETYDVEQYPATSAALAGAGVFVSIDDPDADAMELALLTQNGMRELLMAGGRDRDGNGWLVEIYGDDISTTFGRHVTHLRAAVAVALAV